MKELSIQHVNNYFTTETIHMITQLAYKDLIDFKTKLGVKWSMNDQGIYI